MHAYKLHYPQGKVFTDGWENLLARDRPVTVTSVRVLGGDGYFQLVGAKVAGTDRTIGSIQTSPGFPPTDPRLGPLDDAVGSVVPEGRLGLVLQLGLKITRPGFGYRDGVRVYYEIDGREYYQDLPGIITNCPPEMPENDCSSQSDEVFDRAASDAG